MSRVALNKIRSLTLHKGHFTKSRRLPPVKQLTCVGKPCDKYQPEVVRCYNEGGEGTEIDWVCKADLPEKLRFGRIDVSCEGWDHPGDPFVLKGSCGLEYRLVHIDGDSKLVHNEGLVTAIVLGVVLVLVLYTFLWPCFKRRVAPLFGSQSNARRPPRPPGYRRDDPPPPPYSSAPTLPPPPKPGPSSSTQSGEAPFGNYQPGFWTGLGLGGLGATMARRFYRRNEDQYRTPMHPAREYDWERDWLRTPRMFSSFPYFSATSTDNVRQNRRDSERRAGPSNLGPTRSSTGYGTSSVR